MGMHEWSYKNDYAPVERRLMPHVSLKERFKKLNIEVELGFTAEQAAQEVQRCLNCDVQTVFEAKLCIECDACIDICPVDCLTITHNGEEAELRARLHAPATEPTQPLYVSAALPQTGRVMVKDENLCVHCGLCAERCPTAAWDMQKSTIHWPQAADGGAHAGRQSSRPRKRLRRQDRHRQRHRLGQCQRPADEVDLQERHTGDGQELLPVQHPGAADLVRDPGHPRRPPRPRRPHRHHGCAERRDLRARPGGSRLRRLPHLRLHLAARRRCSSATTSP